MAIAVLFPASFLPNYHHLAANQVRHRLARSLQYRFMADPRFEKVTLTYVDPPDQKGEWLQVYGSVPSEPAKAELRQELEAADRWFVQLNVNIRPTATSTRLPEEHFHE